jgi:hypothetical protein
MEATIVAPTRVQSAVKGREIIDTTKKSSVGSLGSKFGAVSVMGIITGVPVATAVAETAAVPERCPGPETAAVPEMELDLERGAKSINFGASERASIAERGTGVSVGVALMAGRTLAVGLIAAFAVAATKMKARAARATIFLR